MKQRATTEFEKTQRREKLLFGKIFDLFGMTDTVFHFG